jgi:hypothetical protein
MKSRRIGWGTYNDWEKGKIDEGYSFEKNGGKKIVVKT